MGSVKSRGVAHGARSKVKSQTTPRAQSFRAVCPMTSEWGRKSSQRSWPRSMQSS